MHGVRFARRPRLQRDHLGRILPSRTSFIGEFGAPSKLVYYPTVTREPFRNGGRITALLESGKLFTDIGLPPMTVADDRFMLCGSPQMIADVRALLDGRGYTEGNHGEQGHFVIEKAFVDK